MEVEAKLRFEDRKSLYSLEDSKTFRSLSSGEGIAHPVRLENIYLDTGALTISNRGGRIRGRHYSSDTDDYYEITVKCGGSAKDGLHRRYEWNILSEDGKFSIKDFSSRITEDDDPVEIFEELFSDISDEDIDILCSNTFERTTYQLTYGNSRIEACIDYGVITSSDGKRSDTICELELELMDGDVCDLQRLQSIFRDEFGCTPFEDTKYRRTLALAFGK